jgi:hypothetical protein
VENSLFEEKGEVGFVVVIDWISWCEALRRPGLREWRGSDGLEGRVSTVRC